MLINFIIILFRYQFKLLTKPKNHFTVAVKFGVGIALALVSRLVLIRNNPNTSEFSMLLSQHKQN